MPRSKEEYTGAIFFTSAILFIGFAFICRFFVLHLLRIKKTVLDSSFRPFQLRNDEISAGPRFPRIATNEQTQQQREAQAEVERAVIASDGLAFKQYDPNDVLRDLVLPLAYTPSTFVPHLQHFHAIGTLPYFTKREHGLAVLAVASRSHATSIMQAHRKAALALGLSKAQVDSAIKGKFPKGLTEREETVYDLAREMAEMKGPLTLRKFEVGVVMFRREGVAALAQIVGMYLMGSVLVNVGDCAAPETTT